MTADEVLASVASMPSEDWLRIQADLAEMLVARFTAGEAEEIREALAEADEEFARGEAMSGVEVRRQLGLS